MKYERMIKMANYTYGSVSASNGVDLRFMKTSPNNIVLKAISDPVPDTGEYGVNGGFFYNGDILSIAVNDNSPVKGSIGDYGVGWYNEKYARGTLVWDASAREYSVQIVSSASDLIVTETSSYWAQGGISMSLQDDNGWDEQADAEGMPNRTGSTQRTGMVYNSELNVWLVITPDACTAAQFRSAIKEKIGSGTLVDGIFLDGGGSTQMKCAEYTYRGTDPHPGRTIYEMPALIQK
jgi:hypothetical protein